MIQTSRLAAGNPERIRDVRVAQGCGGVGAHLVRFRLAATPGARMNKGRMKMYWVRHYTLDRPIARSISAPQTTLRKYAGGC